MGIAISGAAGLILGLGLLIWGLKQKNARHAAERSADQAREHQKTAIAAANHNAAQVAELEKRSIRLIDQVEVLRGRLRAVRGVVAQTGDMATIRKLLDSESREEII